MLRHSVFAIVLVGAAFAGGAVMNGTGLAWFKALASGGPRIVVDGGPGPEDAPRKASAAPFPTAPTPPLDLGLPSVAEADDSAEPAGKEPAQDDAPATVPTRRAKLQDPEVEPPAIPPVATAGLPEIAAPPTLDPGPEPPPPPSRPKTDPVARRASAQDEGTPPAATAPSPASGPAGDWAAMRRKIRAAGVVRYEIAAEVEGRVRFSCVIPVDGLRAVGHHFEAEGDDEYQAAEAALRRVALWRATESR